MIFIFSCILLTTLMTAFFKEAERRGIRTDWAITLNYAVCAIVGLSLSPEAVGVPFKHPVFFSVLVVIAGALFTANFHLMGINTRQAGLASTAVLSKMSLVLPVIVSGIFYKEKMGLVHFFGIALALLAVVLINAGKSDKTSKKFSLGWAGISLFLTTGITDSLFKVFGMQFPNISAWDFSVLAFGCAFLFSLPFSLFGEGKKSPGKKEIAGGILLGLFNFFALVSFFAAMKQFQGPVLYPVNHAGVLVFSSIAAGILYKEKFRPLNFAGLGAAGLAIALLLFQD